jgi:hypothetical protein
MHENERKQQMGEAAPGQIRERLSEIDHDFLQRHLKNEAQHLTNNHARSI